MLDQSCKGYMKTIDHDRTWCMNFKGSISFSDKKLTIWKVGACLLSIRHNYHEKLDLVICWVKHVVTCQGNATFLNITVWLKVTKISTNLLSYKRIPADTARKFVRSIYVLYLQRSKSNFLISEYYGMDKCISYVIKMAPFLSCKIYCIIES